MFHRFKNSKMKYSGPGALSSRDLKKIIKFIGRKRILNPDEWINKIKKGNLKNKDLCLTFDDGLKSQFNIALPVLNKSNIKAFWFMHSYTSPKKFDKSEIFSILIVNKFKKYKNFANKFFKYININPNIFNSRKFRNYYKTEKNLYSFLTKIEIKYKFLRDIYFSKKKIENLLDNFFRTFGLKVRDLYKNTWMSRKDFVKLNKQGHMIGMHSFSHPYRMSSLSQKQQRIEYQKNFNNIKSITKKKPITMSHPLGSYNKTTLKILNNLGILCGFKSHTKTYKGKKINSSFLELAREDPTNILKLINK